MSGKLITLFLQYENELKSTMPDFAHQMGELLEIPSNNKVNYNEKPVAEYEIKNNFSESEEEMEEEFQFSEDFEKNIQLLLPYSDRAIQLIFENHFDNEETDRDSMVGQIADALSHKELSAFEFDDAGDVMALKEEKEKEEKVNKGRIRRKGAVSEDVETRGAPIRRSLHGEEDNVEVDLDQLQVSSDYEEHEIDTEIEPHCGTSKKKKHKEPHLITPLQYCETCEFEHVDHFRLCKVCNEEHDGCCEVLA